MTPQQATNLSYVALAANPAPKVYRRRHGDRRPLLVGKTRRGEFVCVVLPASFADIFPDAEFLPFGGARSEFVTPEDPR